MVCILVRFQASNGIEQIVIISFIVIKYYFLFVTSSQVEFVFIYFYRKEKKNEEVSIRLIVYQTGWISLIMEKIKIPLRPM